ncbi:MAG TPA: ankyrin repeat domain-containing protein [Pyrinomonadaceae bacterium]|jgi:ankyrin repeat protein
MTPGLPMLESLRRVLLALLLFGLTVSSLQAQAEQSARAELARRRLPFDLGSEAKRREAIASFIDAAFDEKQKIVELYLAAGMDINARDESLRTALFAATTTERNYALPMMLLAKGADPNLASETGRTPLLTAIKYGERDATNGWRAPASAQLIQALLERGADASAADKEGTTPLMQAALVNDAGTIRALLARGARLASRNSEGQTALDIAVSERRGLAVRALIDGGSQMTTKQKFYYYCYRFARLQGWTLPFVIGFSFLVGYFGKKLTRPTPKRNAVASGDELPHLAPLKCEQCGAGVPLKPVDMKCPRCDTSIRVPEDYGATVRLRAVVAGRMERAVAAWRRANLFTAWPVRWTLWLLAPVWLALTLRGLFSNIGNSLFAVKTSVAFLALFALIGGISLTLAFWTYAAYLTGTRRRLPVIPAVGQKAGEAEVTNCHLCGGSISYAAGDLAAVCGYCGGETYRVKLARRAHAIAAEEREQATLSLYDAMAEIVARRQQAFKNLSSAATIVFFIVLAILIYSAC